LIDGSISDAVKQVKKAGYAGDNWFLAAHSMGGYMSQDYIGGSNPEAKMFKA
jgi:alpha-beta hydrolase superfamily lysophospholipase